MSAVASVAPGDRDMPASEIDQLAKLTASVRDFLWALDRNYFGDAHARDSAFTQALRDQVAA